MMLSGLTGLLGLGSEAEAFTGDNVDITLHKRGFDTVPDAVQNDGTSATPGWDSNQYNSTVSLEGVEFAAFDVTEAYYHLLSLEPTDKPFKEKQQSVVKQIQDAAKGQKADFNIDGIAVNLKDTGTTVHNGTVKFEDFENKVDGKHAVYLFVETASPHPTLTPEEPLVVALPVYSSDGTINQDIHIHPKNDLQDEIGEKEYVDGDAEISVDGHGIVDIGDELNYKITVPVTDLMNKVVIKDTPSSGLAYAPDTAMLNGSPASVTEDGNGGFTFELEGDDLDSYRGGNLELTYTMVVTEDAIPDTAMNNDAKITINDGSETDIGENPDNPNPEFFTGGKKFVKHGVDSTPLDGAEFVVVKVDESNTPTHYLKRDTSNGEVEWVAVSNTDPQTWTDAYKITSENGGEFEVTGLKYSEGLVAGESYALVETQAPDGYVVLDEPYKFDIVKDGYGDPTGISEVENIPAGFLPETGGKGIYLFLMIGAMLMAGAAIWYKRSKKQSAQV
ncbi:SpaH/EbpB family LPXTG-anchored major pilin [Enterococcus devriesei]|uniref:SpaH/EbpB family LPXTG-anchored major pilin n=1 Tax=Enterococcus devriesei TaxID=319970 RepID=UPI0036D3F78A